MNLRNDESREDWANHDSYIRNLIEEQKRELQLLSGTSKNRENDTEIQNRSELQSSFDQDFGLRSTSIHIKSSRSSLPGKSLGLGMHQSQDEDLDAGFARGYRLGNEDSNASSSSFMKELLEARRGLDRAGSNNSLEKVKGGNEQSHDGTYSLSDGDHQLGKVSDDDTYSLSEGVPQQMDPYTLADSSIAERESTNSPAATPLLGVRSHGLHERAQALLSGLSKSSEAAKDNTLMPSQATNRMTKARSADSLYEIGKKRDNSLRGDHGSDVENSPLGEIARDQFSVPQGTHSLLKEEKKIKEAHKRATDLQKGRTAPPREKSRSNRLASLILSQHEELSNQSFLKSGSDRVDGKGSSTPSESDGSSEVYGLFNVGPSSIHTSKGTKSIRTLEDGADFSLTQGKSTKHDSGSISSDGEDSKLGDLGRVRDAELGADKPVPHALPNLDRILEETVRSDDTYSISDHSKSKAGDSVSANSYRFDSYDDLVERERQRLRAQRQRKKEDDSPPNFRPGLSASASNARGVSSVHFEGQINSSLSSDPHQDFDGLQGGEEMHKTSVRISAPADSSEHFSQSLDSTKLLDSEKRGTSPLATSLEAGRQSERVAKEQIERELFSTVKTLQEERERYKNEMVDLKQELASSKHLLKEKEINVEETLKNKRELLLMIERLQNENKDILKALQDNKAKMDSRLQESEKRNGDLVAIVTELREQSHLLAEKLKSHIGSEEKIRQCEETNKQTTEKLNELVQKDKLSDLQLREGKCREEQLLCDIQRRDRQLEGARSRIAELESQLAASGESEKRTLNTIKSLELSLGEAKSALARTELQLSLQREKHLEASQNHRVSVEAQTDQEGISRFDVTQSTADHEMGEFQSLKKMLIVLKRELEDEKYNVSFEPENDSDEARNVDNTTQKLLTVIKNLKQDLIDSKKAEEQMRRELERERESGEKVLPPGFSLPAEPTKTQATPLDNNNEELEILKGQMKILKSELMKSRSLEAETTEKYRDMEGRFEKTKGICRSFEAQCNILQEENIGLKKQAEAWYHSQESSQVPMLKKQIKHLKRLLSDAQKSSTEYANRTEVERELRSLKRWKEKATVVLLDISAQIASYAGDNNQGVNRAMHFLENDLSKNQNEKDSAGDVDGNTKYRRAHSLKSFSDHEEDSLSRENLERKYEQAKSMLIRQSKRQAELQRYVLSLQEARDEGPVPEQPLDRNFDNKDSRPDRDSGDGNFRVDRPADYNEQRSQEHLPDHGQSVQGPEPSSEGPANMKPEQIQHGNTYGVVGAPLKATTYNTLGSDLITESLQNEYNQGRIDLGERGYDSRDDNTMEEDSIAALSSRIQVSVPAPPTSKVFKCHQEFQLNLEKLTCPGKHRLTQFATPRPGWFCTVCHERTGRKLELEEGSIMFGCMQCNFYLCLSCHNRKILLQQEDLSPAKVKPIKKKTSKPSMVRRHSSPAMTKPNASFSFTGAQPRQQRPEHRCHRKNCCASVLNTPEERQRRKTVLKKSKARAKMSSFIPQSVVESKVKKNQKPKQPAKASKKKKHSQTQRKIQSNKNRVEDHGNVFDNTSQSQHIHLPKAGLLSLPL